jgi:putative ATP-dependent endonuclease of the OLD family
MKLRSVRLQNVRSFLNTAEFKLDGEISILIGPNGGGKTNLLDTTVTALRRFLLTSWIPVHRPSSTVFDRYEFEVNQNWDNASLERHSSGTTLDQIIELELEVTAKDVANMTAMKADAEQLAEVTKEKFTGVDVLQAKQWDLSKVKDKQILKYRIVNFVLQPATNEAEKIFKAYLSLYDADNRMREASGKSSLSTPMLSLPVNRAASGFASSIALANYNEHDHKRSVDAATSRSPGSLTALAIGRIARKYRLLLEKDSGTAKTEFYADKQIQSLTNVLTGLGYKWSLVTTNALTNQYDVQLEKQGTTFRVGAASSGEKELLTYVFSIYALNVTDALIVIDEPELHLHPKWQVTLLNLFEELSRETRNQFILATHSPAFVTPASIQYVSRVYAENQQSAIIRLNKEDLPDRKQLFSIVNSQNNERVFFADKVILVEGISDRIVFETIFSELKIAGPRPLYEIVSVGGKYFFGAYRLVLEACRIRYAIVADLDYLADVGGADLKKLFVVDAKAIKKDVIENEGSVDGESLVARLDDALQTGKLEELKSLWKYIKSRRRKLRSDLEANERSAIDAFIGESRSKSLFVLSRGSLEDYLPHGYRSKDLNKLIHLCAEPDFIGKLDPDGRKELTEISNAIAVI